MAYTEPNPVAGYVRATMLSKPSIMRYVYGFANPEFFERIGVQFSFFLAGRPTVSDVDCDIIPADRNNTIKTVTGTEKATRDCLTPTEYNSMRRMVGAGRAKLDAQADALLISAEQSLDTVLNASTNTVALATDNTMTRAEFFKGLASIQKNTREGLSKTVAVTSSEALYASLLDNSLASPAGPIPGTSISTQIAYLPFGIPLIIDANFTNSTATGGTAMYLWTADGVIGGADLMDVVVEDRVNALTGTHNILSLIAYAFALTEGVADPRVVRFTNP